MVWSVVKMIIIVDVVMLLDNVLVLVGVVYEFVLIMIGVLILILIIIWGSSFIMKVMEKFLIIIYVGVVMFVWFVGKMIVEDKIIGGFVLSIVLYFVI